MKSAFTNILKITCLALAAFIIAMPESSDARTRFIYTAAGYAHYRQCMQLSNSGNQAAAAACFENWRRRAEGYDHCQFNLDCEGV